MNEFTKIAERIYVYRSFPGPPHDGLGYVYWRVAGTAEETAASVPRDSTILIAGSPLIARHIRQPGCRLVAYTTAETMPVDREIVDVLNRRFAACIVPHRAVRSTFARSGVQVPLHVRHQGYTRFPGLPAGTCSRFSVGFLGVPKARKNLRRLYDACLALAPEVPGLRLHAHAPRFYREMKPQLYDDMRRDPMVVWSEGKLGEAQLARWFAGLSCYVFPSSGEGWSFTPRESLGLGIPTAVSDIPVHRELITSGFVSAVPHRGLVPARQEWLVDNQRTFVERNSWYDIRTEDVAAAVYDLYSRHDWWRSRAREGQAWIRNKWTLVSARRGLIRTLEKIHRET